jgi:hypothetical protein
LGFSPDGSDILPVFSLKTGRYSEQQEIATKKTIQLCIFAPLKQEICA